MPAPPYINSFKTPKAKLGVTTFARTLSNGPTANAGPTTAGGRAINFAGIPYKYPFPSIPRPRRNLFYYNPVATLKRGLKSIPVSRSMSFVKGRSGLKFLPKLPFRRSAKFVNGEFNNRGGLRATSVRNYGSMGVTPRAHRRYNSSSSSGPGVKSSQKSRRRFLRWWLVPSVSIVLWAVWRKSQPSEDDEERPQTVGRPAGPWKVAAYSTLPLKALSRLWGRFNDITLPMWMREPGYKAYSYLFGVNLDEVAEDNLKSYANLGEFFYRELKPGTRPIDPEAQLVSPADGTVLHLGLINDRKIEQVKGITYSLDALLGTNVSHRSAPHLKVELDDYDQDDDNNPDRPDVYERHKNFATMNGIQYTLDELIGNDEISQNANVKDEGDATVNPSSASTVAKLSKDLYTTDLLTKDKERELFFAVIYLAPGDYHRFHSPTNWVAELRRHFAGELYSVAPYFQSRLSGLFVLNERVALLGRWKYGFFSMTPVGATNVGSIRIHFDKNLQTNTVYETTSSASSSSVVSGASSVKDGFGPSSTNASSASLPTLNSSTSSKRKRVQKTTCYEANYAKASRVLGGYPLSKGEQMGGFNLGSTIVLVFEAPKSFSFKVKAGQKVKVGQALGTV